MLKNIPRLSCAHNHCLYNLISNKLTIVMPKPLYCYVIVQGVAYINASSHETNSSISSITLFHHNFIIQNHNFTKHNKEYDEEMYNSLKKTVTH